MLLFLRWCGSECVSKLGSKIDKWAALIRSEELKEVPKLVSTCKQLTRKPFQNLVYFALKSYGFIGAWAILAHNIWLNAYIYITGHVQRCWCSYIYLNICVSPTASKSLFQEATQYVDVFMLLLVISVTMMTSSSKFKQYFKWMGQFLNRGYVPAVKFAKKAKRYFSKNGSLYLHAITLHLCTQYYLCYTSNGEMKNCSRVPLNIFTKHFAKTSSKNLARVSLIKLSPLKGGVDLIIYILSSKWRAEPSNNIDHSLLL